MNLLVSFVSPYLEVRDPLSACTTMGPTHISNKRSARNFYLLPLVAVIDHGPLLTHIYWSFDLPVCVECWPFDDAAVNRFERRTSSYKPWKEFLPRVLRVLAPDTGPMNLLVSFVSPYLEVRDPLSACTTMCPTHISNKRSARNFCLLPLVALIDHGPLLKHIYWSSDLPVCVEWFRERSL
ncbi:hypothetical protein CDAR_123371 [Caerostris darwini]|uniref:Uncharacterized protein n=1 Tax=Caerostris darwini TaxID=1538125 RepID=A0AAV4RV56_9ARAC|nr:hypothetical protein CDAR_123371 [Caerostris darwini]